MYVTKTAWEMSAPTDRQIKLWRYMDVSKFLFLLDKQCLWFSSAENFDDPFEGSHSKLYADMLNKLGDNEVERNKNIAYAKELRKCTYINCWHIRDSESYGMWKVYGKNSLAIAVQTTYEKLFESLKNNGEVILGLVDYKCYETEQLDPTGSPDLIPFFNKSKYFEDEREYRAVIQRCLSGKASAGELPGGIEVGVELSNLIERVYLSPTAPSNFKSTVVSLLKKYDFSEISSNVLQSALDKEPIFGATA